MAFGAAFNYIDGDFDGDNYSADSDSWGFSLGIAAKFDGPGDWNPRAALYGGWMRHSLDQTRRVRGLPGNAGEGGYFSEPEAPPGTWG